ncbi:unnamed protein product [Rotaria magnacalcarata]|uniref:S-adenosyl-L-methionine-dependent tRNA 4-demethylwyosine synthase TYW1 n=2 Tax=Rotaria magnacalcarata TaxID=392030 RepID=A0A816P0C3_9BILA|nr:unnamed protein product [Rotaria magnacalcarata]CAF3972091.1 unnamed protein product [Rotaria magnacalcarata]
MAVDIDILAAGSGLTGLILYFVTGAQWSSWHLFTLPIFTFVFIVFTSLSIKKRFKDSLKSQPSTKNNSDEKNGITIVFGSLKGNSRTFAKLTSEKLSNELNRHVILQDLKDITDPEEFLQIQAKEQRTLLIFISTYEDATPPPSAKWFLLYLQDAAIDFRFSKNELGKLTYAVFGCGNSLYTENFNKVATEIDRCLSELGATTLLATELADENTGKSIYGGLEGHYSKWSSKLVSALESKATGKCGCRANEDSVTCCKSPSTNSHSKVTNGTNEVLIESDDDDEGGNKDGEEDVMDLEDMGDYIETSLPTKAKGPPKEMVTPLIRKSLEKQGYKIIGSHSGVKLCRWTKSMLRGRGGCYKHTFYGIESHRCMETTPSLACANKCVFCWRHHTNPVGTSWQWKTDDAQTVCQGAIDNHYKMINTFKGVPGVLPSRLAEGMQIRHCALSLVGEPIMYPHINELIDLLHAKKISSFLVTNAQFPDEIRVLQPVTQLYVSVDAGTKESLKKIDRPLFRDFWERYLDSLRALKTKGQRTVYRLTLVKGYNTEEIEQYAKLVELGDPDFIEVKGVTYCGDSDASNLTMANVPWHEEVVTFVRLLCERLPQFDLACEHEHSNCLLLANTKFRIDDKWHTWIDYEKFHECVARHKATSGAETFTSLDYMAVTPDWAVIGSNERGFDPIDTRWYRKSTAKKNLSGC